MAYPTDWGWYQAFVHAPRTEDAKGIIGFIGGQPAAAVVYQNWMPASVEVHLLLAKPMIIRHGWLEVMAEAAFGDERQTAYVIIPESNSDSLRFAKRGGFKVLARIPHGCRLNEDCVILTMLRSECRYLKENSHGR